MAHVSQYKKDKVGYLVKLFTEYPIIGAVNLENLPASALQKMRHKLRGRALIYMTKRRLMKVALAEAEKQKKGIIKLVDNLSGMPALLFTKENPFSIYKTIKQSKSPAAAKAGQTAPKDIEVKAGPTPFLPGPIIGELGSIGIKSGVEGGKVSIKADSIVVHEGDVISAKAAGLLARLGIEPMEIGLDITAIYEAGTLYERKVLDVDEKKFAEDLAQAAVWARNLAVEAAYVSKDTIEILLMKAQRESRALSIEADILSSSTAGDILAKAERQMLSVKGIANIEVSSTPKKENTNTDGGN